MRKRIVVLIVAVVLSLSNVYAGLRDDLILEPKFTGLTHYGAFEERVPVAIGKVTDRRSVTDRKFLGKGPNGVYEIYTKDTPDVYVRAALAETLKSLGLAAAEGETPALTIDADVWRSHIWARVGARARLRGETNVRFTIRDRDGAPVGTVSVVGNSEIKGQMVTKERWKALFDQVIYDTMEKLAASQTFNKALPAEVTASFRKSTTPAPQARFNASEIETTKFYGPTELVAQLAKVDLSQYDVLEIRDFKLTDKDFKGDVEATQKMVPAAVMDRIGGLYPTLFRAASYGETKLGAAPAGAKRLIIEGDLPQVAAGSFMKRAMIGFGAGRVSLAMNVRLIDGDTNKQLAALDMKSLNWGAAWQADEGELEDMVRRMASDLTYYLVAQRNPNYKSDDEEVR